MSLIKRLDTHISKPIPYDIDIIEKVGYNFICDDIMRMMESLILKEARAFEILKKQYEEMLAGLPKGSLTLKRGVYYYLNYKEHGKMVSKYVGKKSPETEALREKIEKRRHIEKMLRNIDAELKIAQKVRETE